MISRLKQASIRRQLQLTQRKMNPFLSVKEETKNPFDEDDEEEYYEDHEVEAVSSSARGSAMVEFELPEWLAELSDDLEVYIAQREFESAVDWVFKAKAFCAEHSDKPLVREAANRLEKRKAHLLDVLRAELGTEKSVQVTCDVFTVLTAVN